MSHPPENLPELPPAAIPPTAVTAAAGKRGPLLVLGGVLLAAGLISHFNQPGADTRRAPVGDATSITGAGASGTSGNAGQNPLGGNHGGSPGTGSGSSKAFLSSPNYKAALDVAGMADGPTRSEAMEALIETWVASNPVDAADWAGSLPAGSFRDDAMSALMFHWALSTPADAAAWMARTGVDDPEAASALAGRWAAKDPSSAAIWAEGLTDALMRHDAVAGVAGAWAESSPESAASWVAGLPAADKPAAEATLIAAWSQSSPSAAAAWLARQKEAGQESQTTALAVLTTNWAEQSPGAASKFVNSLPEGPAREAATSQFAIGAAATAPAEALTWAMSLTDTEQRNQVVADAVESWYDGAPEGFRAGISDALAMMDDATMRKGVYEMLYDHDPGFHDNLLKLVEPAAPASVPASTPAAAPASASPSHEDPGLTPNSTPPASAAGTRLPAGFSPVVPDSTVSGIPSLPQGETSGQQTEAESGAGELPAGAQDQNENKEQRRDPN